MRYSIVIFFSFFSCMLNAQFNISGQVENLKGESLEFVSVFLEGTKYAAVSDGRGFYKITDVPSGSYSLKATYVGYDSVVIPINIRSESVVDILFEGEIFHVDEIEIQATRAGELSPFTRTEIGKSQLEKENLGQESTFLFQWVPSVVVTSDAGAGIGYSGMRLRGSDQTRINVTLNGVPVNDAESSGLFWVNMPDLMNSVSSVQIQRGVGTSTNGPGAFGGTVSINTSDLRINPFAELSASYGSFNSHKLSLKLGTGLMSDKYYLEGRFSNIHSDGFVDRATSDLKSYYFSASRITSKSSLKFNLFSGDERTYQSWNGVPEVKINGTEDEIRDFYFDNVGSIYLTQDDSLNYFNSDRRYNYYTYNNQVDKYRQTHLQLIHAYSPKPDFRTKVTLFYTRGRGHYEEFKPRSKWSSYGLPAIENDDGTKWDRSDIIRRRWLDNHLVGINADATHKVGEALDLDLGASGQYYVGDHFGNIIDSSIPIPSITREYKYYDNTGRKSEASTYLRATYKPINKFSIYGDLQLRFVDYNIHGIDKYIHEVDIDNSYTFFNPKFGVNFQPAKNHLVYVSGAIAHKEPVRGDFIDSDEGQVPQHEKLTNLELGYRYTAHKWSLASNVYSMVYKDQLVLTGELNQSGANIRVNVDDSYRYGWETELHYLISDKIEISANAALSRNKIKNFDEILPDYTIDFDKKVIHHQNTDISFSPSFIGAAAVLIRPMKGMEVEWSAKYVGSQFLDNTSNKNRSLPAYNYHNFRLTQEFSSKNWQSLKLTLLVNNVLNYQYSSNGYTYSYIVDDLLTYNFLYPQAGRNFMLGATVLF